MHLHIPLPPQRFQRRKRLQQRILRRLVWHLGEAEVPDLARQAVEFDSAALGFGGGVRGVVDLVHCVGVVVDGCRLDAWRHRSGNGVGVGATRSSRSVWRPGIRNSSHEGHVGRSSRQTALMKTGIESPLVMRWLEAW